MPKHSMAVRRWSPLRSVAVFAALCALAGCRFDVAPDSFDRSADVGDTATEILTVTNTGDEPVELTLTAHGATVALSTSTATLQATEAVEIEISAECEAPGERSTEIAVTGRNSEGAATVYVPFVVHCTSASGTYPVSIEVFQGPPIYKKDYLVGIETAPVPMARPEDGSAAATPIPWGLTFEDQDRALSAVWSADNEGFVTAVWRRQAAVAVTVRHLDDSTAPEVSAAIEREGARTVLPQVYEDTIRDGDGHLTDTVFNVARELYERGAELAVSVDLDGGTITERLTLFGEEVLPVSVTWIPIVLEDLPEEEPINAERWMQGGVLNHWPVGDYTTGVGPTMTYRQTETDRRDDTPVLDAYEAIDQLLDHRALNACDGQEMYAGMTNGQAAEEAGVIPATTALAASQNQVFLTLGPWDRDEYNMSPHKWHGVYSTAGHEMGHMFELNHAPCGGVGSPDALYPYEGATLGPARSWSFFENRFVGRAGQRGVEIPAVYERPPETEYVDIMSYCAVSGQPSDYNYQRSLLLQQSPEYWDRVAYWVDVAQEEAGQESCTPASNKPASTGIVAKSGRIDKPSASIAITGSVDADGIAEIRMVEPTPKPVWPAPPTGNLVVIVLDAGGFELYRQPIRSSPLSHSDGRQVWSARIPYFGGAATVVLRGPGGDVRASSLIGR